MSSSLPTVRCSSWSEWPRAHSAHKKMSIYIYGSLQKYEMLRKFYARMYQIYFPKQIGDVERERQMGLR